jgi:hypothetical protein
MKKITVVFGDKREPLTLLFFKEKDLFVGYLIENGTEILKRFVNKSFDDIVGEIKAFLDEQMEYDYGLVEMVELDDQIKSLLERLSTN